MLQPHNLSTLVIKLKYVALIARKTLTYNGTLVRIKWRNTTYTNFIMCVDFSVLSISE